MRMVSKLAFLLVMGVSAALYGQAAPLDVVLWSEDFQDFDPCTSQPAYDGDLTEQDSSWSNDGADFVIVMDEEGFLPYFNEYFWPNPEDIPFAPDPCNYAMAIQTTDTVGTNTMGYAVKDFEPIALSVSKVGRYLRLDFDTYRIMAPDSWWSDMMNVQLRTPGQAKIVDLDMRATSAGVQQFNGDDIPGAMWDSPAWNHYGIFINFVSDYAALYINDEIIPRLTVPLSEDYEFSDVESIYFGSGIYYKAGRFHAQFFDNIMVTADWACPGGDLDDDCAVEFSDLAVLASSWLEGPSMP